MAITQFPPAAAAEVDDWQLIASATPTSGAVVSFTSIATTWRKLWVLAPNLILLNAGSPIYLTVNSLTSYRHFRRLPTTTIALLPTSLGFYSSNNADQHYFDIFLTNVTPQTPFATATGFLSGSTTTTEYARSLLPTCTSAITQIDLTAGTSYSASNTGTFYLYGTE